MSGLVERLKEFRAFLHGSGTLETLWFGERPGWKNHRYWWRELCPLDEAAAHITALEAENERLRERISQAAEYINRPEPEPHVGPNQALGGYYDAD